MTLKEAYLIATNEENFNKNFSITKITDVGYAWVFGFCDKETGENLFSVPICVEKENGTKYGYFPPEHPGDVSIDVPLSEIA